MTLNLLPLAVVHLEEADEKLELSANAGAIQPMKHERPGTGSSCNMAQIRAYGSVASHNDTKCHKT